MNRTRCDHFKRRRDAERNPRNMKSQRKVICYLAGAAGDWGGASRVLLTTIRFIDRGRYEPLLLLPSKGPITDVLKQLGVRYVIWGPLREPHSLVRYMLAIASTMRLFRRNRVDALHINHANYWRPAEIIAARLLRIPVITHYHVVNRSPGPFVKYSAMIVAVSQFVAEQSEPSAVRKVVVHNSVDPKRYERATSIRRELGLSADDVVVAFVGQIRKIKGVDLFIRLASEISDPHVRFLIVGECRDPAKFEGAYTEEELRTQIAVDSRIRFIGYRSDIESVYASVDLLVMPSRWGEPFGLINIEAGAASRPIVSTRDGGIPEVICHGDNGFLVERDNLDELVRYARLLIENRKLRDEMGRRAREIVGTRFTTAPIRRLERVYEELTR